ncbi:tryptophan--tRNA ligase MSW1 [Ascoidea rubescens DSM 1968]|uniref:Tryptophan--tRNA ligase, mitochondrial n=1 Tax=Ascoidea rubescens DSM 1968 TaxID=1344418 RepID=A0A1D2VKS4_9ASCO|nr:tryptophanyl-tRNA synthetase [Ascoidea rubescens DSM 1968]ODV62211.1 tryptophanyl-tRNA synthetase [Ascoidea rubescens DSM 1968]
MRARRKTPGGKCQRRVSTKSTALSARPESSIQTISFGSNDFAIPNNSTVFSLIQPTGKLHLGNYLGAINVWKNISDSNDNSNTKILFGTADLHAITIPKPASELRNYRLETIASLLASGLDPNKSIIFHQSQIPEHAELTWILSCITGMGYLNRMTQWKSKSNLKSDTNSIDAIMSVNSGLLFYPVLMAADILLYHSTHVPVGDDQSQHLELTRHLAEKFNSTYSSPNFFKEPKTLFAPTKKILSLRNPLKKMSKSDPDPFSCIYITDDPKVISKKIRKTVTDSIQDRFYFDPIERPGVSNLINIISGIQKKSIHHVEQDLLSSNVNDHKSFKDYATEVIINELAQPKKIFEQLINDKPYLDQIINQGNEKARAIASKNMLNIKKCIGLD